MTERLPVFKHEQFREVPAQSLEEIYRNPALYRVIERLGIQPDTLGVFLDPSGKLTLRTVDFHHRTVDRPAPGAMHIKTSGRNDVFFSFDLKGVGFIAPETHESKKDGIAKGALQGTAAAHAILGSTETPWGYDVLGLLDERQISNVVEVVNELTKKKLRTETIAAVFRLRHIWINGTQKTVKDFAREAAEKWRNEAQSESDTAKKNDLLRMARDIANEFQPVMALRCVRSAFRIRDLHDAIPEHALEMLAETCNNLRLEAQILGNDMPPYDIHHSDGLINYITIITRWMGYNLGVLQREGFFHGYLHMGNISLAGEVVDLDSVIKIVAQKGYSNVFNDSGASWRATRPEYGIPGAVAKDTRDTIVSCKKFFETMHELGFRTNSNNELSAAFLDAYTQALHGTTALAVVGVNVDQLKTATQKMVKLGIEQGKPLPRLSAY